MSDYDSKAIEDKAVFEVNRYFEDSKVVATYVNNNEKEPFFDGNLYLYIGGKRDNSHYNSRVAVQVKGEDLGEFKDGVFSYPIEMIDLKAYLHEGIAYFVVQEVKREKHLYYRLLTPVELRSIINEKSGQKTVNVRLKRATDDDVEVVEQELIAFERDCRKQVSFADSKPVDFEDLKKMGIHSFSVDVDVKNSEEASLVTLTSKERFIYGNISEDIKVPLGGGPAFITLLRDVDEPVYVGGRKFYDRYESKLEKGLMITSIGQCFTMTIDPNDPKQSFTINLKRGAKMLKDVICEAEFLLAIQRDKEIKIGQFILPVPFPDKHFMTDSLANNLVAWHELDDTLNKLDCNKDLDLSMVNDEDERTINVLVDMIGRGRSLSLVNVTNGINNVKLANLNLWLVIYQDADGKHVMKSFFDRSLGMKVSYRYDEGMLEESIYSWFDKQKLLDCDNFPYDDVIASYEGLKSVNPHAYERENYFLLALISAYDMTEDEVKKKKMYDAAMEISQWLLEHDVEECKMQNLLNRYQLIKRGAGLSDEDKDELRRLRLENAGDVQLSYAIALLLDDKESYEYYWNKMEPELQKQYQDYMPIYKFHI